MQLFWCVCSLRSFLICVCDTVIKNGLLFWRTKRTFHAQFSYNNVLAKYVIELVRKFIETDLVQNKNAIAPER